MIRKWLYKIRYILIILSALLWILGLSNSFAAESFVSTWVSDVWYDLTTYQWNVNTEYNNFSSTSTLIVDSFWNFLTNSTYKAFEINSSPSYILYWNNNDIDFIYQRKIVSNSWWCYNSSFVKVPSNCWNYWYSINEIKYLKQWNIIKYAILSDWAISPATWYNYRVMYFCFYTDSNESLCVKSWVPTDFSDNAQLIALCWEENWCSAGVYESLYWNSAFYGGSSNWWSTNLTLSSDELLRYFHERYGWSDSMCYVWTNTSAVWGDSVSFDYGSGATIFELYDSIYWSWNWADYIFSVWRFINTWLLNYNYWFNWANNCYSYYSWWVVQQNCSYTVFPFAWQKTAIYFMADLLYNNWVWEDWNLWYEFAVFCDNVFNGNSAAPIKEGSALASNSSSYISYQNLYYWTSTIIQSWSWLSEIFWTWNGYNDWSVNSWSVDLWTFFDKFNWFIDDFSSYFVRSSSSTNPILPSYIIVAFSLILLFGIIRK